VDLRKKFVIVKLIFSNLGEWPQLYRSLEKKITSFGDCRLVPHGMIVQLLVDRQQRLL